jgi:hypothetical protein
MHLTIAEAARVVEPYSEIGLLSTLTCMHGITNFFKNWVRTTRTNSKGEQLEKQLEREAEKRASVCAE